MGRRHTEVTLQLEGRKQREAAAKGEATRQAAALAEATARIRWVGI